MIKYTKITMNNAYFIKNRNFREYRKGTETFVSTIELYKINYNQ